MFFVVSSHEYPNLYSDHNKDLQECNVQLFLCYKGQSKLYAKSLKMCLKFIVLIINFLLHGKINILLYLKNVLIKFSKFIL